MRGLAISLLLGACLIATGMPAMAGGPDDGSQLIYGNFCGPGQRGRNPHPIDALDTACMRHDSCTPDDGLPRCSCHARLRREAIAAARIPGTSDLTRNTALFVAEVATLMSCQDEVARLQP